jgi:hypothetical protein
MEDVLRQELEVAIARQREGEIAACRCAALAAADLPLWHVSTLGYASRSFCGDAAERGWEYVNAAGIVEKRRRDSALRLAREARVKQSAIKYHRATRERYLQEIATAKDAVEHFETVAEIAREMRDDADDRAKEKVQRDQAALRAEIQRLNQLLNYTRQELESCRSAQAS